MGLFWKRKSGDQFVSLKLNEPPAANAQGDKAEKAPPIAVDRDAEAESAKNVLEERSAWSFPSVTAGTPLEPVPMGGGPTPLPSEVITEKTVTTETRPEALARETDAARAEAPGQKPVASAAARSSFSSYSMDASETATRSDCCTPRGTMRRFRGDLGSPKGPRGGR